MAVNNQATFAEFPKCVINIYARFFQDASFKLVDMNDLVNNMFYLCKKGDMNYDNVVFFIYFYGGYQITLHSV